MTSLQQDPSAQAPCTRIMFGSSLIWTPMVGGDARSTVPGPGRASLESGDSFLGFASAVQESVPQLCAPGDLKLREDPVQVAADSAVREEEPLSDFAVGQALSGELGDLQLLGGEAVSGVRNPSSDPFARRPQLVSCPLAPTRRPERVEKRDSVPEGLTRLGATAPAAQPPTEGKERPRAQEQMPACVLSQRHGEQRLRFAVVGQ